MSQLRFWMVFILCVALNGTAAIGYAAPKPPPIPGPARFAYAYDLQPGAVSAPITLPASIPIQVMGVQTNLGFSGVASATLLSIFGGIEAPAGFLQWVGLDSTPGAAITEGSFNYAAQRFGLKILFLDSTHCVQLEVAGIHQIQVHNTCVINPAAGVITVIY